MHTYFSPNSMRVSLRYCPLSNRLRSPLVMLTAPVPDGGYTRTLVKTRSANLFVIMLRNYSQLVEVLRWLGLSRFLCCSSREHPAYAVHSTSPGQASDRDRNTHAYIPFMRGRARCGLLTSPRLCIPCLLTGLESRCHLYRCPTPA